MEITDLDAKIEYAIYYLEMTIDEIERAANNYEIYPREISLSDNPPNYIKAAFELAEMIQTLRNLKTIHRFFKINDEMKDTIFRSYLNQDEPKPIIITETYIVTALDTLGGIGIKFGVDWKQIAEYNDLDSMDLTAGAEIQIPRAFDPKIILDFNKSKNPILFWDRTGFWLFYKRLEKGTFQFPSHSKPDSSIQLSYEELTMILEGIDLTSIKRRSRYP